MIPALILQGTFPMQNLEAGQKGRVNGGSTQTKGSEAVQKP